MTNGILVSDKEQSSYIKPFVDAMDQQVMFAEKSWGSFRVLDVESESMTIKVTLNAGHQWLHSDHRRGCKTGKGRVGKHLYGSHRRKSAGPHGEQTSVCVAWRSRT